LRCIMSFDSTVFPLRPAWVEIDLARLRNNLRLIRRDLPKSARLLAIVKDEAYGHGALDVARIALEEGAWGFGLSTLEEAMALRDTGIKAPLILLGERQEAELPWCVEHNLTACVNEPHTVRKLARLAADANKRVSVHLKINTGMSRYGVRWDEAPALAEKIVAEKSLLLEGAMTHFAQSDELDKTFANLQFSRYQEVMHALQQRKISIKLRHVCNSGGILDLPQAHLDMVRPGILIYGVEVEAYAPMAQRLAGRAVSVGGATIAEGIAVRAIGEVPFEIVRRRLFQPGERHGHLPSLRSVGERSVAERRQ